MSIYNEEEKLFKNWEKNRKGFVRDGVISEKKYRSSDPKIAFILKEVNDPDGGDWDLRKFIAEGGRPQTWNNIARWTHGIRKLYSNPDCNPSCKPISNHFRIENLSSICVMNLKKSPGTHTTNNASLSAVAYEDKDYIKEQYEIYDPDWTICCGDVTGDIFEDITGDDKIPWEKTKRNIYWYDRNKLTKDRKPAYVVVWYHPAARIENSSLLCGLLDAIKEISSQS